MIEDIVSETLTTIGHTWNTDNGLIVPTSDDVAKVLDAVAKRLYAEPVDTEIAMTGAGLIFRKHDAGIDVYVYAGDYR